MRWYADGAVLHACCRLTTSSISRLLPSWLTRTSSCAALKSSTETLRQQQQQHQQQQQLMGLPQQLMGLVQQMQVLLLLVVGCLC
jgi:hypothetical protein